MGLRPQDGRTGEEAVVGQKNPRYAML